MTSPNLVRSRVNRLDRGVNAMRSQPGTSGSSVSRRWKTGSSSSKLASAGVHCRSSPTTITRGASHSRNRLSSPAWLPSSTITTSKQSRTAGMVDSTSPIGMIQAGTAVWATRIASRAACRYRCA